MHKNLYCNSETIIVLYGGYLNYPPNFMGDNHFPSFCGVSFLSSVLSSSPSSHSFKLKELSHFRPSVHLYISYLHLLPGFLPYSFTIPLICSSYRHCRLSSSSGGRYSEVSPILLLSYKQQQIVWVEETPVMGK